MSSAETTSTIDVFSFFAWTELLIAPRMPVTTISPSTAAAASSSGAAPAFCAIALSGTIAIKARPSAIALAPRRNVVGMVMKRLPWLGRAVLPRIGPGTALRPPGSSPTRGCSRLHPAIETNRQRRP